jgi:uncharacterized protein YndB with AHSA1/START domain
MEKSHFEITINATPEKVWDTMLTDATYREWTKPFHEGSYFKGDWSEGSKILFLGPDEEGGGEGGMVSLIKENRLYEFISIEHLGMVRNGVEDMTSEEVKKWVPAFENYTFIQDGAETKLSIDVDTNDEYKAMFEEIWPKALQRLKELCEEI